MRGSVQRLSVLLGEKPEPSGAFHKDALSRGSSVPAPSPVNPTGHLGPFSLPQELDEEAAASRANPPACAALPGLPFLSRRTAAAPGHGRRMLRATEGARGVWPDPQGFLHPRYFAITSPGYAGFSCPGSCLHWEGERAAGPGCP